MGMAKFISHLDLLRCFERAILRSGLPVEYSQGFNPHQKMTFALPLPVGVTSECEAVDIFFEDGKATDAEIAEKLNQNLPPDIRVIKTGDICHKAADIVRAEYIIVLKGNSEIEEQWIKDFFANDEVVVMKKTKKKKLPSASAESAMVTTLLCKTLTKPWKRCCKSKCKKPMTMSNTLHSIFINRLGLSGRKARGLLTFAKM